MVLRPRATPARASTAVVTLTTTRLTPMKNVSTAATSRPTESTVTSRLHLDDAEQPDDAEDEQQASADEHRDAGRVGHQRGHVATPEDEHEQPQPQRQRDEDPGRQPPLGRERPHVAAQPGPFAHGVHSGL